VTPLHKKGSKSDASNYRPISILPVFSKLIERAMHNRVTSFLDQNKVLSQCQFGFQKKKSTTQAINKLVYETLLALDEGKLVLGISCDLSKAFDCVVHSILLAKLQRYGMRGTVNKWMNSYLSERSQVVDIVNENAETTRSSLSNLSIGVPQGSILGPLLFIIYANDLSVNMKGTKIITFADDTNALVVAENREQLVNKSELAVINLQKWFNANKLVCNLSKTSIIEFTTRKRCDNINITLDVGNIKIKSTSHAKFLGIVIDQNLRWDKHTEYMVKKLRSACSALFKLRYLINRDTLKIVYYSYFQSIATYGITAWGCSNKALQRVLVLQKYALRILTNTRKGCTCKKIFTNEKILTIPCSFILETTCFVFTNRHLFKVNSSCHSYVTRHCNKILIPKHNLTAYEKSVYYIGIKLFNHLPAELSSSVNYYKFRKSMKQILLLNPLYCIDKFFDIKF
jgi:hypothetical protein